MITLNVIFTPHTPARLIPFATSLLRGSGIAVRLIDNGCGPEDTRLLREASHAHDRISYYSLDSDSPVEHGLALNHLFTQFREEYFGMVDSDVVANGDFMAALHPLLETGTAVFSGSPVWATSGDMIITKESTWIGARHRQFADGTSAGNSYFAIYPRAMLESAWDSAPRGFGVVDSYELPRAKQAEFADNGWRFVFYDTTRVLNLQLLLEGQELAHATVTSLHHVGGFSAQHFAPSRRSLASLAGSALHIMRPNEGSRLQRLIDGSRHHLFIAKSRRDSRHIQMNVRRRAVIAHVQDAVDAIRHGREAPPVPDFDSPEVNNQVTALVSAVAHQCLPDRSDDALRAGNASGDQRPR